MSADDDREDIPIDSDYVAEQYHYDDQSLSSSRTLATTATMYRYENGRTYHAYRDGEYWQPNDEKQNNHEGIIHHLCIMMLDDGLFIAPIEDPRRILDVGTGSGLWASDMADRYPEAEVIGTDLSPVQPDMHPPNCHFEIDDCCSEWVHGANQFDLVHIRGLFGSISDWPFVYSQAFHAMAPGGYIEQLEWSPMQRDRNGEPTANPVLKKLIDDFVDIDRLTGKSFNIADKMAGLMTDAGFVDVTEKSYKWPVGPWSSDPKLKELGRWNLLNWDEGLEGWLLAPYTRVKGWAPEKVQDWVKQVRATLRDREVHTYTDIKIVYARKPG